MINFTDAQKLACDISRNIAVTAGAGSGKTRVLVERYLWCLRNNGYQVRRIVAITFTEKAAGEMLGRIRTRVMEHAMSGMGAPTRWDEVLEKLALANISTIHSFCQRLLREFPVEAGVDPNFEVFDEALKRICLIHLINDTIRQRAAAYDTNMAVLADLWTPSMLQNVLLHLIEFRETSLPWAKRIIQDNVPNHLNQLRAFVTDLQHQGIRQLASNRQWQETMRQIRALIPADDTSKLTHRCMNILEYDSKFRQQTDYEEKLTTLQMLRKDCRMVAANKTWQADGRNVQLKEAFNQLKLLYGRHLPTFDVHEELEKSGFLIQQALAELFLSIYELYQQEKTARRVLDFDDLQERALILLDNPVVHSILSQRYDYIMVDEFQDTNQLQWNIIRKVGTTENGVAPDKFCIVGDEKQSIYMFRGAEVAVFGEVRRELQQVNLERDMLAVSLRIPQFGEPPQIQDDQKSGELIMAENFRSMPPLIFFFNYLFSRLFLPAFDPDRPYDVQHQELIASKQLSPPPNLPHQGEGAIIHPVEFLFVFHQTETSDEQLHLDEPELVALKIHALLQQETAYANIAILLRTRTRLKEFENALRRHNIPFVVAGGIGFYQQQEIYDLTNLLRFLVDHRQDIALAGVLRSPLLSFSDDQLLYVASGMEAEILSAPPLEKGGEIPPNHPLEKGGRDKQTLWEKLEHHAHSPGNIPTELDPPKFLHAYTLLCSWKSQTDRIPITHLLRRILEDTGLYGILSGGQREVQSFINIEKLLDIARTFEDEGFQSLSDFVVYLDLLIEIEEREGEAQINIEGMDAVRLMTIHAAKGLEFPVVFVPELDRPFNYGTGEPIYIGTTQSDNETLPVVGIKGLDPEQNYAQENTVLRNYLKQLNEEKTDAEMKRLLYVACTRAQDQLILSGTPSKSPSKNSWMAWLMELFPLEDSISQQRFIISGEAENPHREIALEIPIHISEDVPPFLKGGLGGILADEQKSSQLKSTVLKGSQANSSQHLDPYKTLQQNLTPIRGRENEIFRISPSTLHVLFQCPRKYYYQDILQLSEPIISASKTETEHPSLTPAKEGEFSLESPLKEGEISPVRKGEPEGILTETQDYGTYRGTIIHKLFEEQMFDNDRDEQELFVSITKLLDEMHILEEDRRMMHLDKSITRTYQNYTKSGLRELLTMSPEVYREYPFELRIGRVDISGTIDVLFFDAQREMWTILDYKSNEIKREQMAEAIKQHGYDIQMQLYALAVSQLLRTDRIRSILFFTFPGCVYDALDLSPETLKTLETNILSFLDQVSEGRIEVSQKQLECEECGYRFYKACP